MEQPLQVLKAGGLIRVNASSSGGWMGDSGISALPAGWQEGGIRLSDAPVILIADIAQLYNYVAEIPEIAWDILEFAEKPLHVIFDQGKNVRPFLLSADGTIKVCLVKAGPLQQLIMRFKRALFFIDSFVVGKASQILPPTEYVLNLDPQDFFPRGTKTMRLRKNGEFKFLN